jgi:UDP-N-acetyl-D-glucosamine dehydrogenase
METMGTVAVIGQGYVGLPLAMASVKAGFRVYGIETDAHRVQRLSAGESYVEDVSSDVLRHAIATGRYTPSEDIAVADPVDVAVITVPTPLTGNEPDLSFVKDAAKALGPLLRPGMTVILESTTYPGTTEEVLAPLLESASGLTAGRDFALGFSPERIDPGNATWTLTRTPKIVSGVDDASLAAVQGFYERIVERTVPVRGTREAELAKLLENTFRYVNIALINEIAVFAADAGIDVWEAVRAAETKPFGYLAFRPGPGVGGHCLPIDPSYLAWHVKQTHGRSFKFVELANEINDQMPHYVVDRVRQALEFRGRPVEGSRILVLGLAYKADTSDARESPVLPITRRLLELGAVVRAVDPHVTASPVDPVIPLVPLTAAELVAADAVLFLVDHSAFDREFIVEHARYVFDARNRLTGPGVERL